MIKIKELKPYNLSNAFGAEYMTQISVKNASIFAGMYPLPKIGYEIVVGIKPNKFGFYDRLLLQNICGDFFLASSDTPVTSWPDVFGVKVERKI